MQCKNHPDVVAVDRCVGCAEPYCHACLVEIHGQKYCSQCKVMALPEKLPLAAEQPMYGATAPAPFGHTNPYAPPQSVPTPGTSSVYNVQPRYRSTVTCPAAKEALVFAIVGIFFCPISPILEIAALVKAREAKLEIAGDSSLEGKDVAIGAQVIACVVLLLTALIALSLLAFGATVE